MSKWIEVTMEITKVYLVEIDEPDFDFNRLQDEAIDIVDSSTFDDWHTLSGVVTEDIYVNQAKKHIEKGNILSLN